MKKWRNTFDRRALNDARECGRLAKGVPDRSARIKADGNAVVPQQAYPIFAAIAQLSGITGQLK